MKTRMKLDATKAGFIGNRAVEDYHAAHVEHLDDDLVRIDGFFSCPACRTNPLAHMRKNKVMTHLKQIAAHKYRSPDARLINGQIIEADGGWGIANGTISEDPGKDWWD